MLMALTRAAGLELGAYRRDHVDERVRRALAREGLGSPADLVVQLARDRDARRRFQRSVAISVSGLFRDPAQFELIERAVLPALLEPPRPISVWSAGCADGSELYSVAMLLRRAGALERAHLLGTDVLEENLEAARGGSYDRVLMPDAMRARLRWERRDLVREDAPPGPWQLILCRNVAIYLTEPAKRRLHRVLAESLAPRGALVLGRSERLGSARALGLERIGPHAYRRCA
jgi:chemotaxis protein methyltransferase CheR